MVKNIICNDIWTFFFGYLFSVNWVKRGGFAWQKNEIAIKVFCCNFQIVWLMWKEGSFVEFEWKFLMIWNSLLVHRIWSLNFLELLLWLGETKNYFLVIFGSFIWKKKSLEMSRLLPSFIKIKNKLKMLDFMLISPQFDSQINSNFIKSDKTTKGFHTSA